jgi:hypothetical protein
MNRQDFENIIYRLAKECPVYWRMGQKVFNVVDAVFHTARTVQCKGFDCFYDDSQINVFIDEAWEFFSANQRHDEGERPLAFRDDNGKLTFIAFIYFNTLLECNNTLYAHYTDKFTRYYTDAAGNVIVTTEEAERATGNVTIGSTRYYCKWLIDCDAREINAWINTTY